MLSIKCSILKKSFPVVRYSCSSIKHLAGEDLPAAAYNPRLVESNKYVCWEQNGYFLAEDSGDKPIFSTVLPPPNITGKLHLGHALASTIQDVIVRYKRARGYNVLWIPGTDHAGIATQGVVEKYLQNHFNLNRQAIGREKFNTEVWKWNEKHGNTICQQLRTLGCSLDWQKQIFTMEPSYCDAVNTAFIQLFKKGLIYRKKALINWCNKLKSTVSDIEVENLLINSPTDVFVSGYKDPVKFGLIYDFAYKIADSNEEIVVSTTMPETMLGDVAIAVHPDDKRYEHLFGKRAVHPFQETTIPIIFDEMVDIDFGTGAVKITPAHSKIDYAIAKDHNLPLLQVIDENGLMINSGKFNTMKRYDCRSELVKILEENGFLRKISPHEMSLPICSRTGDVIEHLPKDQWFLSCQKLNAKANELVELGKLKIEPQKYVQNWMNWTADDRDWCISRQLWWGHQIPAYKCVVDNKELWVAAMDEISAKIEASKLFRTSPDAIKLERDTDVLDTWFSSGIYPFASLGWPLCDNSDYQKFYPLSLLATGHDILGFWVHRMVILGLELTGSLPFDSVFLHGVICDSKGSKMSKSRGNVIDPIDVINGATIDNLKDKTNELYKNGILSQNEMEKALTYHASNFAKHNGIPECGVDALRFTLLSQDVKSHFVNFDVEMCHANKLFCNKIWQSVKYLKMSLAKLSIAKHQITSNHLNLFDKWILSRLANMVETVNKTVPTYEFHLATKALRTFIYNEFCDIYLETTKPGFENPESKVGHAHAHTLSASLNVSLRCLAPFMIYLTQEVIPKIPSFDTNIICNFDDNRKKYFDFPQTEDFHAWQNDEVEKQIETLMDLINVARQIKALYNISNKDKANMTVETTNNVLKDDIESNKPIISHLIRCGEITFEKETNKTYVSGIIDKKTKVNLELSVKDADKVIMLARHRLEKKIQKMEENISKFESKMSSSYYLRSTSEAAQISDRRALHKKTEELELVKQLVHCNS